MLYGLCMRFFHGRMNTLHSVMYWYWGIVTAFRKVSTKNIPLSGMIMLECITCINSVVQLFRLLTKKRNRKSPYRPIAVKTAFSGVQSETILFPADAKLCPQGRIKAKPGGGVTPPRISDSKKGPSRKRRGCVRFQREA